MIDFLRK